MGRPLRIKATGITYHITSRTNGKQLFMKKSKDRKALCKYLQIMKLKYQAQIYGFTPMGNHFHLLVKMIDQGDISRFMCELKTAYAKYYNTKYTTSGHFWGDRFRSTLVQDDQHMLACLRYVDRNPVRAGLVEQPAHWQYSTFRYYAHGHPHEVLQVDLHPTYLALSPHETSRQRLYRTYVIEPDPRSDGLSGSLEKALFYGSESFIGQFK